MNRLTFSQVIVFVVVVGMLSGCATQPKSVDANRALLSNVRSLAVIRLPDFEANYAVLNMGHPGRKLGMFGGFVATADQADKERKLTQALRLQKLATRDALVEALATRLSKVGFEASVKTGKWQPDGKRFHLKELDADSDATLVIIPTVIGFVSEDASSDYLPTIIAMVTVTDKAKTVLYRGFHSTGYRPKEENWRHTPARTGFRDFDTLMANPEATGKALGITVEAIASTVADDLKR